MRQNLSMALWLLAACNGKTESPDLVGPAADQAQLADLTTARDLSGPDLSGPDLSGYPAGPYGYLEGNVLSLMIWEGYPVPQADAIATSKPYGFYTANDIR